VLLAKPQRANEVSLWYLRRLALGSQQIDRHERTLNEDLMIGRIALAASVALAPCVLTPGSAAAQDVPGIEICTVEKTMERRTSCLQSNVDFLQKTLTKLAADHQQKLDAARAQVEALKSTIAGLQKIVDDLQAQKKAAEDQKKKADAPPAKDTPVAKEGGK
jgi:septal ring factor EnvC (AmiA/AmiB activator)